jgi:hypothetical protein
MGLQVETAAWAVILPSGTARRATGAARSSRFWVRSSENLELRTSNRLT